jgi:hypothetical protein
MVEMSGEEGVGQTTRPRSISVLHCNPSDIGEAHAMMVWEPLEDISSILSRWLRDSGSAPVSGCAAGGELVGKGAVMAAAGAPLDGVASLGFFISAMDLGRNSALPSTPPMSNKIDPKASCFLPAIVHGPLWCALDDGCGSSNFLRSIYTLVD